ncbi:MAG: hypothetical protein WA139_06210 [Candidatus Aenigmatarchaeota archaeon]
MTKNIIDVFVLKKKDDENKYAFASKDDGKLETNIERVYFVYHSPCTIKQKFLKNALKLGVLK